jgi:hypothetical protein
MTTVIHVRIEIMQVYLLGLLVSRQRNYVPLGTQEVPGRTDKVCLPIAPTFSSISRVLLMPYLEK